MTGRSSNVVRVAVVALALALLVPTAFYFRDATKQADASRFDATRDRAPSPRVAKLEKLYRDAEDLNPDTSPRVSLGFVLIRIGEPRQAIDILAGVTREEPQNSDAWGLLARAAQAAGDRALAAHADAVLKRLNPRG